jgi:nitrate reductase gamma subunit
MEFSNLLTSDIIYNLARGPLVWISILVCIVGTIVKTLRLVALTKKYQVDGSIDFGRPKKAQPKAGFTLKNLPETIEKLKLTVLGTSPVTVVVSFIFHCCLILVPLFLLAHNILIEEAIGFSIFSLPEKAADGLTMVFLICGAYFLSRRLFMPRVRAITTFYDYVILFITVAPFLTGFLAYYQYFDYKTIIILHMLAGELMLVAIPFTKVFHMVFFFIGRFVLVNQHTIGKGSRTW